MGKYILISLLVATIAAPAAAARDRNPVRGMKRVVYYTVVFNILYTAALIGLYLRGI